MAKILLVEDDTALAERLSDWLSMQSHLVESVENGEDALQMLENYAFDLVILDWGLPTITGVELLQRYRHKGGVLPVIMLTGRNQVQEKISGLDAGADDYLPKPFHASELSARIRSLLRRPPEPSTITLNGIALDPVSRQVTFNAQSVTLRPKEAMLLELLMRNPNHQYDAKKLLHIIWSSDDAAQTSEDTVRSSIKNLRRQLAAIGLENLVQSLRGEGYFIEAR